MGQDAWSRDQKTVSPRWAPNVNKDGPRKRTLPCCRCAVRCVAWSVLDRLVDVTEIDPRLARTTRRGPSIGFAWIVILVVAGLASAFYLSILLALSIDEHQRYSASIAEYGDTASMNAGEAEFGIQLCIFLLAILWLFVTGIAAAIAAGTRLSILRTVVAVGGGLALFVGVVVFLGLTIGTV
jgi:hypothetical protein